MKKVLKYCFDERDFCDFEYEVERDEIIEALVNILIDYHKKGLFEEEIKGAKKVLREMFYNDDLDDDVLFDRYEEDLLEWFEDDAYEAYSYRGE